MKPMLVNDNWTERTELLLGRKTMELLAQKHVLVVGLGGVGAYAAEMIARAGVGNMTIVDGDVINPSNKNRQLAALCSTIGKGKAHVMAKRLLDINPELNLEVIDRFIRDNDMIELLGNNYDYVVDAIDTLSPKVYLIYHTFNRGIPIVSSMGAGGKTDPSKVMIADISKSHNCKLARVVRKRLNKLGLKKGVQVVFSTEFVDEDAVIETENELNKKSTVGTISYLPPIFGIFCASKVIRDLAGIADKKNPE